jgi:hypothetical protein
VALSPFLFFFGAQLRYVALLVMLGVAALVGLAVSAPYRLERLTCITPPPGGFLFYSHVRRELDAGKLYPDKVCRTHYFLHIFF